MKTKLALYEVIDTRFDEWNAYDPALKIILISGDIEIYGREKFKKSVDHSDGISLDKINELQQEFSTAPGGDKERLKKIYTAFIDELCKPDRNLAMKNANGSNGKQGKAYTERDEFKLAKEIKDAEELEALDAEVYEQRTIELGAIGESVKLSDIEKLALNYIKDRKNEKHPLLECFTLKGIIQIANRAAYKLYFYNHQSKSAK